MRGCAADGPVFGRTHVRAETRRLSQPTQRGRVRRVDVAGAFDPCREKPSMTFDRLLEPFQYGFMVKSMLVAALVGGVCAILSCYLVLMGWSLMGDAVSHAVLPGIVIAYVVGAPLAVGAFVAG